LRSKAKVETFGLDVTPQPLETMKPEAPTLAPQQRR
jgi:hypothetical protein